MPQEQEMGHHRVIAWRWSSQQETEQELHRVEGSDPEQWVQQPGLINPQLGPARQQWVQQMGVATRQLGLVRQPLNSQQPCSRIVGLRSSESRRAHRMIQEQVWVSRRLLKEVRVQLSLASRCSKHQASKQW